MKPIGDAAAAADKRARHRKFHWCRQANDFIDMPLWRLVAEMLHMPLHQVQAFALRLESLANRSQPRGYVGDFRPAEFGIALGMSKDDSARLYAAFEQEEIGWILQDHLATFYERNPDLEDEGANERKQRERSFKAADRELADLAQRGYIDDVARADAERSLSVMRDHARRGQLPIAEQRRHIAELMRGLLSTVTVSRRDTVTSQRDQRDIVTVTPEQIKNFQAAAVDNSGAIARGSTAGSPMGEGGASVANPQADAEAWLAGEGNRIVVERMQALPKLAETKIERWKRELQGDAIGLALIIDAAADAGKSGAAFHVAVTDGISRRQRDADDQRRLPLVQSIPGKRAG